MAQEPKPSGGNTCAGTSQRVDSGTANAAVIAPHYVYQDGYNRRGDWRGHWILVR
jgi:hypothetical protein